MGICRWFVLAALLACSSEIPAATTPVGADPLTAEIMPPADPVVTLRAVCERGAAAYCARLRDCYPEPELDAAACEADYVDWCCAGEQCDQPEWAVVADHCEELVGELACDDLFSGWEEVPDGCHGEAPAVTRGEVCTTVAAAYCDRMQQCEPDRFPPEVWPTCTDYFASVCCGALGCDAPAEGVPADAVAACAGDLAAASCEVLADEGGSPPASCDALDSLLSN